MKKYTALLMGILTAFGMTACGSVNSPSDSAVSSVSPLSTAQSSASADIESHTPDAIKARGKLIITTEATYAPFEFQNANGEIVGLDVSIARALAEDLGVELEIQNIDFNSVVTEVQAGNADLAIAGLSPSPERKENVDMSDIYYGGKQCMLVLEENAEQYATVESLKGETIATQKGTVQEALIKEQFPDSVALTLPKFPQCIAELKAGNCAAVVMDDVSAEQFLKSTDGLAIGKVEVETDPAENGNAIAVMKGNHELLNFVNDQIEKYINDGSIQTWFDEAQEQAASMGIA